MRFFFIICGFVIALLFWLMLSHDVMIVCYLMMLLAVIFFDCGIFFFFRLGCVLLVAFIFCGVILTENWKIFGILSGNMNFLWKLLEKHFKGSFIYDLKGVTGE